MLIQTEADSTQDKAVRTGPASYKTKLLRNWREDKER
jgi:hypothetical protein